MTRVVSTRVATTLVSVLVSGCATARSTPRDADLFAALAHRDLAAFEHQIALAERQRANRDVIALARGWDALLTCRPIVGDEPDSSEARFGYAAVRAEQSRHLRMLAEGVENELRAMWLGHLHEPDYFKRVADQVTDETSIAWLGDPEIWIDEAPVAVDATTACMPLEQLRATQDASTIDALLAREVAAADHLAQQAAELVERVPEHANVAASLGWVAAWHALSAEHRRAITASDDSARWQVLRARSEALLARPVPREITPTMSARARLLSSELRARDGDLEGALASIGTTDSGDDEVDLLLRYRRMSLARRLERWDIARHLTRPLPPRTHPMCAPIAFEAARIASASGAVDEVLDLATSTLRDRAPRGRFLAALLQLALFELAALEFDARTLEVVEDLGLRHRTHERVAQLAAIALEQDRATVTANAARWLRVHDPDGRNQPRYLTWLALAAFLSEDRSAFSRYVGELIARRAEVRRAVGRSRESAFFADQDRALSALLGELMARMAEWAPSRDRDRATWLELVVHEVQTFLRETAATTERDALTTLYRAASGSLRGVPRGYPEHLSSSERASRAPRVIGRVRVMPPEPMPLELGAVASGVASLAVIPAVRGWTLASDVFSVPERASP